MQEGKIMAEQEAFTVLAEEVTQVAVPGLGNVTSAFTTIGSSTANAKEDSIGGFHLTTPNPAVVLVQPRQSVNSVLGYPDQFAVQVIYTDQNTIRVRTKRLDSDLGWGQNLRLDFLVIDKVNI